MKTITHSLKFITELDETNPTAQRILELPHQTQTAMLNELLNNFDFARFEKACGIDEIGLVLN
jgi:hypothetical protein